MKFCEYGSRIIDYETQNQTNKKHSTLLTFLTKLLRFYYIYVFYLLL